MLQYLADENLPDAVAFGLRHHVVGLDIVLTREVDLSGIDDPEILEWAALQDRIVLTHDVSTLKDDAYARVAAGQSMPGVFVISRTAPLSLVIEELQLLATCSNDGEWEGQVLYVPLK